MLRTICGICTLSSYTLAPNWLHLLHLSKFQLNLSVNRCERCIRVRFLLRVGSNLSLRYLRDTIRRTKVNALINRDINSDVALFIIFELRERLQLIANILMPALVTQIIPDHSLSSFLGANRSRAGFWPQTHSAGSSEGIFLPRIDDSCHALCAAPWALDKPCGWSRALLL